MKAVIITEAGTNIGFGHLTRCIALSQKLIEKKIDIEFVVNADVSVLDLMDSNPLHLFNWIKGKQRLFKVIESADIVIIDSYLAELNLYEELYGKVNGKLVIIDDNIRLNYPGGIVINPSIYGDKLNYPGKEHLAYLLGKDYVILRSAFWKIARKSIRKKVESVMVTFGGIDRANVTSLVLEVLNESYPELEKHVIIGKGFSNIATIERLKDKKTRLEYWPDAEKMKNLMLASDVAISAGGQTLYELARVGVATIGVCVADNQQRNVLHLDEAGFINYIGQPGSIGFNRKLCEAVSDLKNTEDRRNRSIIGRKIVDGRGVSRIVEEILKYNRKNEEMKNEKQNTNK